MPLSEQELLQVLEMFQQSRWQNLQLSSGARRLVVSKAGHAPTARPAATVNGAPVSSTPITAPQLAPAAAAIDPRWIAVRAPLLGTFYAAPKPGAPPFVALGQGVSAEDNIGIVEVMKLMNYVKAGAAGRVALIAARNGELVEYDEPLIYLDPAGAS